MIVTEILSNLKGGIRHVTNSHLGCSRLSIDEFPKLIQVSSYARVERIVDQDKQRKRSVISLCRNYLVYLEGVLALFHLHVHRPENGRLVVITECLVRDHHVNL